MNIIRIVVDFQLTCPKQNCPKIIKSIKQVKTVNIIGYSAESEHVRLTALLGEEVVRKEPLTATFPCRNRISCI